MQRLLVGVDVRVGLVHGGDVGVLHHLLRDISMHVERKADGHRGPDQFTHAAHQFTIGIAPDFRHRRAV